MKILMAEDDLISRRILEAVLTKWAYGAVPLDLSPQMWGEHIIKIEKMV